MQNLADDPKVQNDFLSLAENIGSFIEYWGFKKIHGKIWTLIFISNKPVDAKFLIENLNISKALVSMTLKELLQYNVILEVKKDSPCTQKYLCNEDILSVIFDVIQNREVQMLEKIQGAHDKMEISTKASNDEGINKDQLENLGGLLLTAQLFLKGLLQTKSVSFGALLSSLETISE